ncbi:3-ketosteroid 9alpha-monooxygenase subunit B [Amycolatopsis bartoniae]|uniref:Oxidoreductase n=1 Tax=Amycolatopsis bartoniae TaxID=941986 RepID=A0A8H9J1I1_9PSEU|nr:ferredoxin--NADP reductase [Amycolatopsis bartoniae]MBB2937657.1 3-ketosteroid 9alpha-monooxygenase subunit B [Amycolatopsis bartoniae]TVT01422.1 ferredoxin--NADP reductase [Amycolatopsis bartoniae]GHF64426.1 oxidoreductase [Amycolatopsis bartoniae]
MPEIHTLTVAEVIAETPDARSVVFELTPEQEEAFRYRPGQFLTLRVGTAARCYSLSSAPHEGSRLKVTVKRTEGGYGSNWICDNLRAGLTVDVLAPAGVFTPADFGEDLLLFAGGSGITPVMSILKTALRQGDGRITLIYANRDERSVIFGAELAALSREFPERLTVLHWLETVQGLPTVEQLRALAKPFAEFEAFLCGPAPFMTAAKQALIDLGVAKKRIHLEKFVSLGGNPFETTPVLTGETTKLSVDLDGAQHEYAWPRQRKLLDFLLDQGLDAPYSCREGQCSACACRIVSGEVKMLNNEILDSEDIAEGIVLACQSVPLTDEVSVTYE